MLTVLLILPVYWGWWRVGVDFTLSHFYTAKMFDAPFFKAGVSDQSLKRLLQDFGSAELKLGVVGPACQVHTVESKNDTPYSDPRIGIAESGSVCTPQKETHFPGVNLLTGVHNKLHRSAVRRQIRQHDARLCTRRVLRSVSNARGSKQFPKALSIAIT